LLLFPFRLIAQNLSKTFVCKVYFYEFVKIYGKYNRFLLQCAHRNQIGQNMGVFKMKNKAVYITVIIFFACAALALAGHYAAQRNYREYFVFNGHNYGFTNENLEALGLDINSAKLEPVGKIESNASKKIFGKNKELESDVLPVGTEIYFIEYRQNDRADPNILAAVYKGELKIARREWTKD